MSSRNRKLTEKGYEYLERNLRAKCLSALTSASTTVNKLSPLIDTSDISDIELVRKYHLEFEQCVAHVLKCRLDYCDKFCSDSDIIAEFNEWFQPRLNVLQSLQVVSKQWLDDHTTANISNVPVLEMSNHHNVDRSSVSNREVGPDDSVSQAGRQSAAMSRASSKHSSRSGSHTKSRSSRSTGSKRSSVKSVRLLQSLEKVTLLAEASNLEKRQSLMRKEFELGLEKETLNLSTKLAIARAKEEVLQEYSCSESEHTLSVCEIVPQKPLDPTTPNFVPRDLCRDALQSQVTLHDTLPVTQALVTQTVPLPSPATLRVPLSVTQAHNPPIASCSVSRVVKRDPSCVFVSSPVVDATPYCDRFHEVLSGATSAGHVSEQEIGSHRTTSSVSVQNFADTRFTSVMSHGFPSEVNVSVKREPFRHDVSRVHPCGDRVPQPGSYFEADVVPECQRLDSSLHGASTMWPDSYAAPHTHPSVSTGGSASEPGLGTVLNRLTDVVIDQRNRLPEVSITKFSGDTMTYHAFVRSFDSRIASRTNDISECFYYLDQYTTGTPNSIVRSCLHMSPSVGYAEARRRLDERYGNPFVLAQAYLAKLDSWPTIRSDDVKKLDEYSTFLIGCLNAMTSTSSIRELDFPSSLRVVASKLPVYLQDSWARTADKITYVDGRNITLSHFVTFLERETRVAMNPLFGKAAREEQSKSKMSQKKATVSATALLNQPKDDSNSALHPPCLYCSLQHSFATCKSFRKKLHKDKYTFLMQHRLCFDCLCSSHMRSNCPKTAICELCKGPHPTSLHKEPARSDLPERPPVPVSSDSTASVSSAATIACVNNEHSSPRTMPVIPVKVKLLNRDKEIATYAFIDSGSTDTIITETLMRQLGAQGRKTVVNISTVSSANIPTPCYAVTGLEISGYQEDTYVALPAVFSQSSVPVSQSQIPTQNDIARWPYLSDLTIPTLDAEVGILLGGNAWRATEPWKIINSEGNGPYAVYTRLGWVVNGPLRSSDECDDDPTSVVMNRVQVDSHLDQQLQRFFQLDFSERRVFTDEQALSVEDRKFLSLVEQATVMVDGHYEVCLPLRDARLPFPNNRPLVEQRMKSLKKKFVTNDAFKNKYKDFVEDLFVKGHASVIPEEDHVTKEGEVWYLPHFGVFHLRKNKLRVVLDASARFGGTSLNDRLLSGPDMTNTLIGVLIRFRQEPVGLMADLECMFYQVKVPPEQRDWLRFLWWPDGDVSKQVVECRMHTHIFGATSSPAVATYALQKTARDNASDFSEEAVQSVLRAFYVDDCLKSVASIEEGVSLSAELRALTQRGGFRLTGWVSNSSEVLGSIPETERSKNIKKIDLDYDVLPAEKALGVFWKVDSDELGFQVNLQDKPVTRRGVLSTVCSLYDPLGMVAPFVLTGKVIMQECTRLKLGWDDSIPEDLHESWQRWLDDLLHIESFFLDRCFKPSGFGDVRSAALHHFADASRIGYGCVSYIRLVNSREDVHVSFVFGKSRVAPLKQLTVPRLELTAAVVAARIDCQLQRELDIDLDESQFWTDSTAVLGYIKNEQARFHTFVANRVATIHEQSESQQWHYVPTETNPADYASRGLSAKALIDNSVWKNGPQFLWESEESWPTQPTSYPIRDGDPEEKKTTVCGATVMKEQCHILSSILYRFSDWYRLRRFVALLQRGVRGFRHSRVSDPTTADPRTIPLSALDLREAEVTIVRWVQQRAFTDELTALKSGDDVCLPRGNKLAPLCPILVDGVLRVGGRIGNAPVSDEVKHPVILPADSPVSQILVRWLHKVTGHGGREQVLAKLRERFWVIHSSALVRQVLKSCVICRRGFAGPLSQKMADLPSDRITPHEPPFTNTGVDYFGPILVKRGRSLVKRWGALFTCLVSRAVHIEMAAALDTDSFINVLRRFIARRGQVKMLRSDNGSNFIGAEKELRQAIGDWNQSEIGTFLLQREITWHFNAPTASHHGGAWERLIRSTRRVMTGLLKEQVLSDDGLNTLLAEVESILNGRPLTRSSSDPQDLTCLTPNDLLLMKDQPTLPPGVFSETDNYVRHRWRQVQYLSDLFWKRWVKEYLTLLQERQKWLVPQRNVQVGDIVLLVDNNAPRGMWPLGKVVEAYSDRRGLVRKVLVKTRSSTLLRPISKLVLVLECESLVSLS